MIVVPIVYFFVVLGIQNSWSAEYFENFGVLLGIASVAIGLYSLLYNYWKGL